MKSWTVLNAKLMDSLGDIVTVVLSRKPTTKTLTLQITDNPGFRGTINTVREEMRRRFRGYFGQDLLSPWDR